jgi:hypothetical protein
MERKLTSSALSTPFWASITALAYTHLEAEATGISVVAVGLVVPVPPWPLPSLPVLSPISQ